jgi:hypothetical protein
VGGCVRGGERERGKKEEEKTKVQSGEMGNSFVRRQERLRCRGKSQTGIGKEIRDCCLVPNSDHFV